jgi:lysophospholipase L1-like esterase
MRFQSVLKPLRLPALSAWMATWILVALAGCSPGPEPLPHIAYDATILAFGDSLTAGTGASPAASYPAQLESLTARRVINAGRPGEVSRDGAERLPALLDEHKPDLLILIHGGNDFLRRVDIDETRGNLATMIQMARERGVEVVLVAVPAPTLLRLRSEVIYRELGEQFGIPVENEALAHILSRDALKADPIHPNADGYRHLAERIHRLLIEAQAL